MSNFCSECGKPIADKVYQTTLAKRATTTFTKAER